MLLMLTAAAAAFLLQEALLCYCRLAVTLGGLQPKQQGELLTLVNRDVGADGLVW
jgi:hypothetical protein